MTMLASVFSLVACRMGGDKPNNDNPGTNDKPDSGNNNDDATNDNSTDNENSDGAGNTNDMPAITGERIEISFSENGYAVGQAMSVTAKLHIPENNFFSNVDRYELVLVKGVYDALMYPEKDHKVLTTIQKADKDKYTNIIDMNNMKYYDITKNISIPTDLLTDNSGKFTIALVGLKANDHKSIISSAYHTYHYTISGNKISINK